MKIEPPKHSQSPGMQLRDMDLGDTFMFVGDVAVYMRTEGDVQHAAITSYEYKYEATPINGPGIGVSRVYPADIPVNPVDILDSRWEFQKP